MNTKYCGSSHPKTVAQTVKDPHICRRMLTVREIVEQRIQWSVGRGEFDICQERKLNAEHRRTVLGVQVMIYL